jgi:CheY-like chemotaxis protein
VPLSILVVDDHPVNRFVASELLEQLGDEVDLASSGADAIEAVARKDYDVVFMDVQMPELNGIETTKQLCAQQAGKKLPAIIALTASILEEDREACRAVGMLDFLVKPLDIAQVDSLLGRVAAQRKITAAPEPTQRWRSPEAQTEPRPTSLIDNPQLVSRLCQMFVIDAPVRVAMMQDSLARGDSKDIELRAHSLRTACTMLGASHMAELCAQIEEIARAGRIVELASWVEWLSVESSKVVYALARNFEPGSNAV